MKRRRCGDCRECCIVMTIEELEKPHDTACPHLCAKGCGIYELRPEECRRFECFWLVGILPGWMKPNKVHAVVWPGSVENENGDQVQIIRANFSNRHKKNKRVLRWLEDASHKFLVIMAYGDRFTAWYKGRHWDCGKDGDTWRFELEDGLVKDITVIPKGEAA